MASCHDAMSCHDVMASSWHNDDGTVMPSAA